MMQAAEFNFLYEQWRQPLHEYLRYLHYLSDENQPQKSGKSGATINQPESEDNSSTTNEYL
jgi:hypothetical protein